MAAVDFRGQTRFNLPEEMVFLAISGSNYQAKTPARNCDQVNEEVSLKINVAGL